MDDNDEFTNSLPDENLVLFLYCSCLNKYKYKDAIDLLSIRV